MALLAKSYNRTKYPSGPPDYALLVQHSKDVAEACQALVDVLGDDALRAMDIRRFSFAELRSSLIANGWIQDLGKANSHFQRMLISPDEKQLLRHETISALIAWGTPLRSVLEGVLPDIVLLAAIWGACGHHRKFDAQTRPKQVGTMSVYCSHKDFNELLTLMALDLGIDQSRRPNFQTDISISLNGAAETDLKAGATLRNIQDEFADLADVQDFESRKFVSLVKSLGIGADIAASAVAKGKQRNQYSLRTYISESLSRGRITPEDIDGLIEARTGAKPQFRQFQIDVGNSQAAVTLAEAGCGTGKSLAAYLWARRRCPADDRPFRLIFCLPTTGTTTEHFKDYALESGVESSLTHSRASVDLQTMAETAPQEEADSDSSPAAMARSALAASRQKIEALALWSTPLIVTTSDTVLGIMSNGRKSLCSLPAVLQSAVVFDEIHAFDSQMFGHLLIFLKAFPQLPVLLMTASLPVERKRALQLVRPDLEVVAGPEDFELLPRYLLAKTDTPDEVYAEVEACIADGGKVLWIRNRVEWANQTFHACSELFGRAAAVMLYHSRYRYCDRSHLHRNVIDTFKDAGRGAILVATQVAEMSLDLSADLLVTDIAAIPALIQRLGRLNRRATPAKPGVPKKAIFCPIFAGEELPYTKIDLQNAVGWLDDLMTLSRAVNQRDLSEQFGRIENPKDVDIDEAEKRAVFLSGVWETRSGLTRDEGYTISVLLERDVLEYGGARDRIPSDWIRNHEVSIPYRDPVMRWERVGYVPIAPSSDVQYDFDPKLLKGTGASWR